MNKSESESGLVMMMMVNMMRLEAFVRGSGGTHSEREIRIWWWLLASGYGSLRGSLGGHKHKNTQVTQRDAKAKVRM